MFFFAVSKAFESKHISPFEMQKNLTIILADVVAQSAITIVRGVFAVQLRTVFVSRPVPVRVRR